MSGRGGASRQPGKAGRARSRPAEVLASARRIERILQRAVREALTVHKKLGNPIATWKGGKVVWIPPKRIPVDGR